MLTIVLVPHGYLGDVFVIYDLPCRVLSPEVLVE